MSLETTGEVTQIDASGYDQVQTGEALSKSSGIKASNSEAESRMDKNLRSARSTVTTEAAKASIAFKLSFTIKIANRTPFNPQQKC